MTGRSLELFYIDGNPEGMVTAEVFGWTGHVLRIPRLKFREGIARPETAYTGCYLLVGESDGEPRAYIGEAEKVGKRLRDHEAQRDWWSEAYIITSTGDALHKAHVKYLESRMVEIAKKAGAVTLDNGNVPPRSSLNEAAVSNMETFLETLQMILPALGVSIFLSGKRERKAASVVESDVTTFVLETPRNGVKGRAKIEGSNIVVLAGSRARQAWESKGVHDFGYAKLHRRLVHEGVLLPDGEHAIFSEDYAFNSPSAAAAVLNGRPANGQIEWKVERDGRTLREFEAAALSEASA